MLCPNCGSKSKSAVKETRPGADGAIRRRRRCPDCYMDFETLEHVSSGTLRVRKSDGRTEPFDRAKLRRGIVKAAVRPHHSDRLTELVESIAQGAYHAAADDLVESEAIGMIVLEHLKEFDPVTYVRFALTQLGRRDQAAEGRKGWKNIKDFRRWLGETYPELQHFHPPGKITWVVKRDGRREPFDPRKLERSIGVASKGRGESDETVRQLATQMAHTVIQELMQQTIVTSGQLTAEILRVLRESDHIAAVRFASTAKSFVSVEDYETEAIGLR